MKINGFCIAPAGLLADRSLSDGDKVMFTIICGYVDFEQKVREDMDTLVAIKGVDERSVRRHLESLASRGWLHRRKIEDHFYLYPQFQVPVGEGDPVILTTKAILDRWNHFFGIQQVYTTPLERLVKRRLKSFTPEMLMRAVNGRIAFVIGNSWFDKEENKAVKYNLNHVFQSDEAVAKFINQPVGEDVLDVSLDRARLTSRDDQASPLLLE